MTTYTTTRPDADEWAFQAYRALQGAEVLAQCLADAKVELCEATDAAHFLGNNDNAMAIRDALASWPNAGGEGPPP